MNTKTINILFSRYKGFSSNLIYFFFGRTFTHVSIALDNKIEYFYSFNKKGFRKEYPIKHKKLIKSELYTVEVTDEEYEIIKQKIEKFEQQKDTLKYSPLGVFLCFFNVRKKFKNKYFCSQFVAESLQEIKSEKIQKDASLYSPNKLHKEVINNFKIKNIIHNPIDLIRKKQLY